MNRGDEVAEAGARVIWERIDNNNDSSFCCCENTGNVVFIRPGLRRRLLPVDSKYEIFVRLTL